MGINSQSVSYDFGQMGSMLVTGTAAFYPPKDMVIVAITSLDSNTDFDDTAGLVSDLVTDISGTAHSAWIGTEANVAHKDANHEDADAHNDNGGNATGVITLDAASALIKPGMIVEHATMCPRSLTDPYVVKSVDGTSVTLTKKLASNATYAVAANYASGSSAQKAQFYWPRTQGFGGIRMQASAPQIPSGVTIYGRWTAGKLAAGSIIAYFGI
tara:strand:+ start:56 stop:697 length:642 start_codon:yes stop_codon:yes gene_type:complete